MTQPLPVTILSGFLGAGKTTLLNHILNHSNGRRLAIVINDVSGVNIDAALIGAAIEPRAEDAVVEMSNGCICCTLRDDLIKESQRLAGKGCFDHLLIEATGISSPRSVAAAFVEHDGDHKDVPGSVRLDMMVTVVDACNVLRDSLPNDLQHHGRFGGEHGFQTLPELLTHQIEFADVIVLNKIDLVSEIHLKRVRKLVRTFNPDATIIETSFGAAAFDFVLNATLCNLSNKRLRSGKLRGLPGNIPDADENRFSHFVYEAFAPFHPERFYNFLGSCWQGVIRAKGFFWLASRPARVGELSHVGRVVRTAPWCVSWPILSERGRSARQGFTPVPKPPHWSHRNRQQIVFIGSNMDDADLRTRLNDCLIDVDIDENSDFTAFDSLRDPFPAWS